MTTPTTARALRTWLGLEPNLIVVLFAILLLGMGEELWLRFLPKYLEALGAATWGIALYGTLNDLLDAVYQYPGGWLADRLGRRRALRLFTILATVGFVIFLFAPRWEWILIGTVFALAWDTLTLPATFAVIADNLPQTRRAMGFGVQSILKRIPIIVAPPLGGLLIGALDVHRGVQVGLIVTVVLALLVFQLIGRYVEPDLGEPLPTGFVATWRGLDSRLKRLLVADSLARWAEGIPKVFIVLYVIDVLRMGALNFGWLTSLRMLTSILLYIPIARLADRINRKPFVLLTFIFFALFPLALVSARNSLWVAGAFVVAGLREIGEPARKALIVDLAPAAARGRAVGMYYLARGLAVFPASIVGGLLWTMSPALPFYAAFVVGVAGLVFYALTGGEAPASTSAASHRQANEEEGTSQ